MEAGHRCAVPTCKQTAALQFAHIVPWSEARSHEFGNMIVLCAICHARYDTRGEIDRKSILGYKSNLAVLNSRYGELERRLLNWFGRDPSAHYVDLDRSIETRLQLSFLINDGLLELWEIEGGAEMVVNGFTVGKKDHYIITRRGREMIRHLDAAEPILDA
ncbi:HNH endonuclease [Rathayibacter toxicus]|nr:HNH endonuclease signature motif containing protein [Rathayibacter toxicus]QWL29513.1 HNH endonuclease [Rathayibacter toxicus]